MISANPQREGWVASALQLQFAGASSYNPDWVRPASEAECTCLSYLSRVMDKILGFPPPVKSTGGEVVMSR